MAINYLKQGIKAAAKKMLAVFLPVILPAAGVFLILLIFVAAIYGSMPQEGHLTGVKASVKDEKLFKAHDIAVKEWNVADYYKVSREPEGDSSWYLKLKEEKSKVSPKDIVKVQNLFNKNTGSVTYLDNNGKDAELANKWGDVYSTIVFDLLQKGKFEFPKEKIIPIAKDLHPYFFVKSSSITECYPVTREGKTSIECHTYSINLLVEAKTIRGWYKYNYEWQTDHFDNGGRRTYERLKDVKTLEKWEWLEDYLIKTYKLKDKERTTARMFVFNASEGFSSKKEWMEWLTKKFSGYLWLSSTMVPPDLKPYFQQAGLKYSIPWWFLAAVALKESSFDIHAVNDKTGCFGLMQVSPANWNKYAPALGFDVVKDKDNPRAQIMVGAYMLSEQGLKYVNWESPGWKEQTLSVLVFYGGYRGPLAEERCKTDYAEVIWAFADRLKLEKIGMPAQGPISSYFGKRFYRGKWETHDGIDIAAPEGSPIVSVSGGVVEEGQDDLNGIYVRVKDLLYSYSYIHMSKKYVVNGEKVLPGQVIGLVGNTGKSDGPHLHFAIKVISSGVWIDPLLFLERQERVLE